MLASSMSNRMHSLALRGLQRSLLPSVPFPVFLRPAGGGGGHVASEVIFFHLEHILPNFNVTSRQMCCVTTLKCGC